MPQRRIQTQNTDDSYRYKGTKKSAIGETQQEYESSLAPGKAESYYVESGPGDVPAYGYKGQPGGWAGMNYYREDDGK